MLSVLIVIVLVVEGVLGMGRLTLDYYFVGVYHQRYN